MHISFIYGLLILILLVCIICTVIAKYISQYAQLYIKMSSRIVLVQPIWIACVHIPHISTLFILIIIKSIVCSNVSPAGVPVSVANLKDGTSKNVPLEIFSYLNEIG